MAEMVTLVLPIAVSLSLLAGVDMGFKPPAAEERVAAVGPTADLPAALRAALDPGSAFDPIPVPGPNDWLAAHPERGQTFEDFARSGANRPEGTRKVIYLQPLGDFLAGDVVQKLKACAEAYFGMPVTLAAPLDLARGAITTRNNPHRGNRQLLTSDVLDLLKSRLPDDAFCVLAITMEDLYPDPSWNFVFGQASLQDRVGVYSLARYDPAFYGEARGADYERILLRRSCRILAHETAHMFGLTHCVYFRCVLNGSNHLAESDSRPLHLCPVCLRKLQSSIGFDIIKRYQDLLRYYQDAGLDDEAQWVQSRLRKIGEAK